MVYEFGFFLLLSHSLCRNDEYTEKNESQIHLKSDIFDEVFCELLSFLTEIKSDCSRWPSADSQA